MKTVFIESIDNKFFRNILITNIDGTKTVSSKLDGNIYELFYRYKFDYILLSSKSIDGSILQFAIEYNNRVKIIVYVEHDLDKDFINTYKSVLKFLINKSRNNEFSGTNFYELSDTIINSELYYLLNDTDSKQDYISCFLDNIDIIPEKLIDCLWPKTKLKIRMFNNPKIKHIQNLGSLNELDKSNILKESKYYLDINGSYLKEAILFGCKILTLDTLSNMTPLDVSIPIYKTYDHIMREILV